MIPVAPPPSASNSAPVVTCVVDGYPPTLSPYQVVRGEAAADRSKAIQVWNENSFGSTNEQLQKARYDWFYLCGPHGVGLINFLKVSGQDHGLGFLGAGLRDWTIGGNLVVAGVLVDFVVHPDHRTALPALALQRYGRSRVLEIASMVIGLPGPKAVAIFKRLGSTHQFQLARYVRVLRYNRYLSRFVPAPFAQIVARAVEIADRIGLRLRLLTSSSTGEWLHKFDDRFDQMWAQTDKTSRCIGVRNQRFLHWRFSEQPGHAYRIFAVSRRSNELLQMYFVCELLDRVLIVKDLLGAGTERETCDGLLLLTRAARRLDAIAVSIQVLGDEILLGALRRTQFVKRDGRPFFAIVSEEYRARVVGASWYVTQADEDV